MAKKSVFQARDRTPIKARIFRVSLCFGRGLILLRTPSAGVRAIDLLKVYGVHQAVAELKEFGGCPQIAKHPLHVFTEHGAIMLASVLNGKIAVQASIYVVRAFLQMRASLIEYGDLSRRIDALAATYDHRFQQVFTAIRGPHGTS